MIANGVRLPNHTMRGTGEFPLPDLVADYYQQVGPDELYCLEETQLTLYLPSLRRLAEFQTGILENTPVPGQESTASDRMWRPAKLAIAIHHTHPFILDVQSGSVAFSRPGSSSTAGWLTTATLESLAEMMVFFGVLESSIGNVEMFNQDGEQSIELVPYLINQTSQYLDRSLVTTLLETMYG